MARKIIIILFILSLTTGINIFARNDNSTDYSSQILTFEKKFRSINQSIDYLKKNNMETADISKIYTDAGNLFKEIKDNPDSLKDYDMALQLLTEKISALEEKTAEKIAFARRTAFMYIIMVAAGLGIILFMVIYSVLMYFRRK